MLQLSDIRKNLNLPIQKGIHSDYLSNIAENKHGIEIDYDVYLPSKSKNLQRPFCWTPEQKQELIISVLKGITLPSISLIIYTDDISKDAPKKTIYKIIDGKQRLSTLISFYKNEFPIIWEDNEYYFKDLDEWGQHAISRLTLISDRVYEYPDALISDEDKVQWFFLINWSGTPQDKEHMNNLLTK